MNCQMRKWLPAMLAAAVFCVFGGAEVARAADLPKSTQKVLKELKIDPSIMNGLEAELKVPQAWLDGAAKEEEVVILGTWPNRQFPVMTAPFRERYPFVKLNYHRAGTAARGMRVAIALREGRVIGDVMTSIADAYFEFKRMDALADLRELPGIKNVSPEYVADDGTWVGHKISFRCMAYNTTKVKKADLPQKWDDLLTNPKWRNGRLAVTNHPNSWLLALWATRGEKWGETFTSGLFDVVRPQQRKEGMSAATALTVAGELYANIPAPEWQVQNYIDKGAPIAYHCPSLAPVTLSQIVMLKNSPHKNSARLFINWMLSREGQILQYYDSYVVPVHKALQSPRFVSIHDMLKGKKVIIRDDAMLGSELHKKMAKLWKSRWTSPVGKGRKKKRRKKK